MALHLTTALQSAMDFKKAHWNFWAITF
jgi:hypothetical protein